MNEKTLTVFTTVKMPSGATATIFEGRALHFFRAMSTTRTHGQEFLVPMLISQLVRVNDKPVTVDEVMELTIPDASYLTSIISECFLTHE